MVYKIYTIGHSNRSSEEFIRALRYHGIKIVVDVRRFPTSKHSQFKQEALIKLLKSANIDYTHIEALGGYRRDGYEHYMQDPKWVNAFNKLEAIATDRPTAIMCAERFPWRCHRRYIARQLVTNGWMVVHILNSRVWIQK